MTLFELNNYVKQALTACFAETIWVTAETSDVRSHSNGHCYLELVEKEELSGAILAKARANIWRNRWQELRTLFEESTGEPFVSGLKVMVEVSVTFHEVYGYALVVQNIDPTYTLGEMQRRRKEILSKLERERLLRRNGRLPLVRNVQRVAVISSVSAAGFQDFMTQLEESSYSFYVKVFPAVMQGADVEQSIIRALHAIERQQEARGCFDATVIIRGGGATTDLNGFESYALAEAIARHTLPVLTGIGHERDESIPDFVAHTRLKTPTAVAAYLIEGVGGCLAECREYGDVIVRSVRQLLASEGERLTGYRLRVPHLAERVVHRQQLFLASVLPKLGNYAERHKEQMMSALRRLENGISSSVRHRVASETERLKHYEQMTQSHSAEHILRRGFSITLHNGAPVVSASQLAAGARLTTQLYDGTVESEVITVSEMSKQN